MSYLMPYIGLMQSTVQGLQASSTMQNINQNRMALAAGVGPNMTQAQINRVADIDKAMTLQGLTAQVMFEANSALQEANRARLKKEFDARAQRAKEGMLY